MSDQPIESRHAQFPAALIGCFNDAVGEQDDRIAGLDVIDDGLRMEVWHDTNRQCGLLSELSHLASHAIPPPALADAR